MKKKAINVEYRKTSESFPEWLKYEVTILSEDGKVEKIPAYGKDLQDALSRVVHDEKVEKIAKKTNIIPWWGWSTIWFIYLLAITLWYMMTGEMLILVGGIGFSYTFLLVLMLWGKERNRDKS